MVGLGSQRPNVVNQKGTRILAWKTHIQMKIFIFPTLLLNFDVVIVFQIGVVRHFSSEKDVTQNYYIASYKLLIRRLMKRI